MSFRRTLVLIPVLLSLVSAICIWFWFPNDHSIFIRADSDLPLHVRSEFLNYLRLWIPVNLGTDNSRIYPTLFPYVVFWYLARDLFNDSIVQRLWWIFLESTAIFSATWLTAETFVGRTLRVETTLVAVSAFAFSGYAAISFATGHDALFLALALAPALLAATARYFRTEKVVWAVCAALIVSLGAGAFTNPPMILTAMVIPEVCLLGGLGILGKQSLASLAKFVACFMIVMIPINAWWLMPYVNLIIFGGGSQIIIPTNQHLNWPNFTNAIGSRFGLFGIGYWGLFRGVNGHPYFPTASLLQHPAVICATGLILLFGIFSIMRREKRAALFTSVGLVLFAIGIWGAKANNEPFAALSQAAFANIPGLWIFRSAYEKFEGTALIGLLLCVAQGYPVVTRFIRLRFKVPHWAISVGTIACAVGFSFPFLSGTLVKTNNPALGYKAFVDVPPEYSALSREVARLGAGRILVVPGVEYALYKWGAASGDILRLYLPHSYISVGPHYTGASNARLLLQQLAGGSPGFKARAAEAGVRYILVRSDVYTSDFGYQLSPSSLSYILRGAHEVFRDRYFKIYKLKSIVPPLLGVKRDPNIEAIPYSRTWYGYNVTLPPTAHSSNLVLRTNFSDGWHLAGISSEHYLAGDFANRWPIGPHGKISVRIYYIGSILQVVGAFVTGASLVCLLILTVGGALWQYRGREA